MFFSNFAQYSFWRFLQDELEKREVEIDKLKQLVSLQEGGSEFGLQKGKDIHVCEREHSYKRYLLYVKSKSLREICKSRKTPSTTENTDGKIR